MTLGATSQSSALTGTPAAAAPAAAAPAAAPAAGAAGGLSAIMSLRVKRIDPKELQQAVLAAEQAQLAAEEQALAQMQAMQAAQGASATQQQAPSSTANAAAQAQAQQAAAAAATVSNNRAQETQQANAAAATQAAAKTKSTQRTNSLSIAPRTKDDYWTSHIAQFRGKYLPDGPSMRPNCGPASVTMALRMIGLDIPGANGQNSEAVLDKARMIATGQNNVNVGTTDTELERVITASGAKWSESNNFEEILGWVQQGIPVILAGNPANGWNPRYTKDQVYPYNGGHWVTVSGYDAATGFYIVNDPLSQIGPILVSKQELKNYNSSHGSLGIAVFR